MRAHGQDRQAKHEVRSGTYAGTRAGQTGKACSGTVTHAGTWAGQTGKACNGERYICGHKGRTDGQSMQWDSYTCGHIGRTDRQSMQWGQLHMRAHWQDRQSKRGVGTDTQGGTGAGPIGREAVGTDTWLGPRERLACNCNQNKQQLGQTQ